MISTLTTTWWCAYQQKKVDFTAETAGNGYIGGSVVLHPFPKTPSPKHLPHEIFSTYFSNRANGNRFF
jgi:hypothetical protein